MNLQEMQPLVDPEITRLAQIQAILPGLAETAVTDVQPNMSADEKSFQSSI
jgi:hypothetical protein